jgi:hypothetical protein
VEIDLDDAGVRGDLDDAETRVLGRRFAFDDDGEEAGGGGGFDDADEFEVIRRVRERRHEDVETSFAGFDAEGGADDVRCGLLRERCGIGEERGEGRRWRAAGRGVTGGEMRPLGDGHHGVRVVDVWIGFRADPWEGIEGEAETHGGIAGC